jgi:hypothetical protein
MAGFCGIYQGCKRANLHSLCHDDRICPILVLPDFKFGIADDNFGFAQNITFYAE